MSYNNQRENVPGQRDRRHVQFHARAAARKPPRPEGARSAEGQLHLVRWTSTPARKPPRRTTRWLLVAFPGFPSPWWSSRSMGWWPFVIASTEPRQFAGKTRWSAAASWCWASSAAASLFQDSLATRRWRVGRAVSLGGTRIGTRYFRYRAQAACTTSSKRCPSRRV